MSAIERLGYLGFGVKDLDAWKRSSTHVIRVAERRPH